MQAFADCAGEELGVYIESHYCLGVGGGGSYASYSVVFMVVEGCDGEHFVKELGVGRHFGGGLV